LNRQESFYRLFAAARYDAGMKSTDNSVAVWSIIAIFIALFSLLAYFGMLGPFPG
jgi:hypothetical protein